MYLCESSHIDDDLPTARIQSSDDVTVDEDDLGDGDTWHERLSEIDARSQVSKKSEAVARARAQRLHGNPHELKGNNLPPTIKPTWSVTGEDAGGGGLEGSVAQRDNVAAEEDLSRVVTLSKHCQELEETVRRLRLKLRLRGASSERDRVARSREDNGDAPMTWTCGLGLF